MISKLRSKIKAWLSKPELSQAIASWPGGVVLSSLSVTILVVILRQLGAFQGSELHSYDQFLRLRPNLGVDERLLVVGVTEQDLKEYGYPLSDQTIADILQKLEENQARAIGLDIFRDVPQGSGRQALAEAFKSDNLIVVCGMNGDEQSQDIGTNPPQEVQNPEKVGFADFSPDYMGVIRRGLLMSSPLPWENSQPISHLCSDPEQQLQSLSVGVALLYLESEGITPEYTELGELSFNSLVIKSIDPNAGGYINAGEGDYQILLNYRSTLTSENELSTLAAEEVSVTQLLKNQVPQDKIRDRIVLIGYTTPSVGDFAATPFGQMSGVQIHAQLASQILSIVLDEQAQISYLPDSVEWLFILVSAIAGSSLVWLTHKNRGLMLLSEGLAVGGLFGISYGAFIAQSLWLPLVPSAWALILAALVIYIGQKPVQKALKADGNVDWDQVREEETKKKEATEKKYRQEFLETLKLQAKQYQEQIKQWRKKPHISQSIQDLNPGEQIIIDNQLIQQEWINWLEKTALESQNFKRKWQAKGQDKLYQGKRDSLENLLEKSRLLRSDNQ